MRYTPMSCTPIRYTPMRCTPVRYTPHEVYAHAYEVHAHEVASASLYSPCLSQHQANVVDASERVRVLWAQYLLISSERLRVHRFGLFILALSLQHRATAVVTKSESRRKGIVDNGISASRLSP